MLSLSLVDSRRFIAINRVYPEAHTSHLHSHFQAVASHELVALSQLWICFLQKKKKSTKYFVWLERRQGRWEDRFVTIVNRRRLLRHGRCPWLGPFSAVPSTVGRRWPTASLSLSFHFEILFPSAERVAASQNRQFRQWKKMQLISFIF